MSERPIVALSTTITIVFPGRPISQPMPRVVQGGRRTYRPKAYTDYRDELAIACQIIAAELEEAGRPWNAQARSYAVRVRYWMPDARSTDLDKLVATTFDAFTRAGLWGDDRMVTKLRADRAICKDDPRVEVEVSVEGK